MRANVVLCVVLSVFCLNVKTMAQVEIVRDTFQDDTAGLPPDGPEIGNASYAGSTGSHRVVDLGSADLRLASLDTGTGGSYLVQYTPIDDAKLAITEYVFRVFRNSNPVGSNAFNQQLILRPLGLNLTIRWGADSNIRVNITRPGDSALDLDPNFDWSFDRDYKVTVITDADTDTFSLEINGADLYTNEPLQSSLDHLDSLVFVSNFATTGETLTDNVIITSLDDPCEDETTPPVVEITDPPEFGTGCTCEPVTVVGSAYDPDGGFDRYVLRYRQAGGPWVDILTSPVPVINGVLANWNTAPLSEGHYMLQLVAYNQCGLSASTPWFIYLSKDFNSIDIRYPDDGDVVAGNTCLDGTVWDSWCFDNYEVAYRAASGGTWKPVDDGYPSYSSPVANDPFARWSTEGIPVPDGKYDLRVTGRTVCSDTLVETRTVIVDNTKPVAEITSPRDCAIVSGLVEIIGTVDDDNLDHWILQITGDGIAGWQTIASGTAPVHNGVLAIWDADSMAACAYTFRLRVYDQAIRNCNSALRQWSDDLVSISNYACGDFDVDDDGDVDLFDYWYFNEAFTGDSP